ncbi:flagellar assembly protein FliH [Shouchella shacheensis]|uniref:flagellar assembly protein FliH n=1 Tax=Shouchella shacheensis TaxID=1649580 RepID=UPI00073FAFA9|nr:flagellar assembly protein FliH [Shouchella shacheensis]
MSNIIKARNERDQSFSERKIAVQPFEVELFSAPPINNAKSHVEVVKELDEMKSEAHEEANELLASANEKARQVLEKIEQEQKEHVVQCEQVLDEARRKGYEEGYEEARKEVERRFSEQLKLAAAIVDRASKEREEALDRHEGLIIELAHELSYRVLSSALEEEEMLQAMLKQIVTEVREHRQVKLYVPPEWYERISDRKQELNQLLVASTELAIVPDGRLSPEGCIVQTSGGRMDASLDVQLIQLKEQLLTLKRGGSLVLT